MLFDHLTSAGPVAIGLMLLSVVAMALMLERLWVHMRYPAFARPAFDLCCRQLRADVNAQLAVLVKPPVHGWQSGAGLLLAHRQHPQQQRQQLCLFWLGQERNFLNRHLKLLGVIATLAPLLGLLGTVFGIIEMFKAIAHNSGPVTPALLAAGMWTAMITTALGLLIAIPALAASHGLDLLCQRRIARLQDALNELDFALCGMSVRAVEAIAVATPVTSSKSTPHLAAVEALP